MNKNLARVVRVDGEDYVHIGDMIGHLNIAAESVMAFCSDDAPLGAKIVHDTLCQVINTLDDHRGGGGKMRAMRNDLGDWAYGWATPGDVLVLHGKPRCSLHHDNPVDMPAVMPLGAARILAEGTTSPWGERDWQFCENCLVTP